MNDTVLRKPAAWIIVAAVVAVVAVAIWAITSVGSSTGTASADGGAASTDDAAASTDGGGGDTSDAAAGGDGGDQSDSAATTDDSGLEPAPDVTLDMRQDGTMQLSDFEGEPVVLNFWASWCPPCVSEMGELLEPAHQQYGDQLTMLGVNLRDVPEDAQDIIDETGVTYQSALDPDGEIFAAFSGVGMPTTVFIDEQGRIVEKHTGILTEGQLKAQIDALLEG